MALARRWLWTIPLSASLSALLSPVPKSNHKLFPQNPHSFMHPISSVSSHFLQDKLFSPMPSSSFSLLSCLKTSAWFPIHCPLPQIFSSSFMVTLRKTLRIEAKGSMKHPTILWVLRTPFDPPHCPTHQNIGDSSSVAMLHPNHLSIFEKALLELHCLKGLGPNVYNGWTKQLLVWLIAYLLGIKSQQSVISITHGTQQWKQWKWVWTARQLCAIRINAIARLCPQAEDVREQAGLQRNMWLISSHGDSPSGSGWETGKEYMSARSINNKKHCFCTPLWESESGAKEMWTVSPQKEPQQQSTQLLREAIFPPALNHSPVAPTELLSIHQAPQHPRQAQQKAF